MSSPSRFRRQPQHSFLIIFENEPAPGGGISNRLLPQDLRSSLNRSIREEHSPLGKQIVQLRQELAATREYLQSIIESQEGTNEELQSANEEIQSGNEELQSTNEELQTSKEELESANEELHTVNEEMQHRNELLTQLNNDLTNLLYSVSLPIVMVGADLSVRRYHPAGGRGAGPDLQRYWPPHAQAKAQAGYGQPGAKYARRHPAGSVAATARSGQRWKVVCSAHRALSHPG